MTIKAEIVKYAANQKQFTGKDLFSYFHEQRPDVSLLTVEQQLYRLVRESVVIRLKRGVYRFEGIKNLFVPKITNELRDLNALLKEHFPYTHFCLWYNNEIVPYMHHIPNLQQIFVEVEHDAVEAVFNYLDKNCKKTVYIYPDSDDLKYYIIDKDVIIVRGLVSEAPVQTVDNITLPTIEKILVDVLCNIDFEFMRGTELHLFYQNVLDRCVVNRKKLLRYASRRNRKKTVEQLINEIL